MVMPQTGAEARPSLASLFELQHPQSIALYPTYEEAQRAVDFLADNKFEVKFLSIVGTDLRTVERVTGRRTWGSVLRQGIVSGLTMGLFVGLMFSLFITGNRLASFIWGVVLGTIFSVISAAAAYAMSGGARDFDSIRQTVATRYEILGESKVADQARQLLMTMPEERRRAFGA